MVSEIKKKQKTSTSQKGKQRILEAASKHFQTASYARTRVDDICEMAGISKGAFYLYFQTKEEMMEELFRQFFSEMQGNLQAFISSHPPSPIAALELFRMSLEVTQGELHMTRLFFEAFGSTIANDSGSMNTFVGRVFNQMAGDLQKWMQLPESGRNTMRTLISCMDGIVLHWAFFKTPRSKRIKQMDAFLELVDHSTSGVLPNARI